MKRFDLPTSCLLLLFAAASLISGCDSKQQSAAPAETGTAPANQQGVEIVNASQKRPISFNKDIRPILSDKCFFCHGPDRKTREEDLRLDIAEAATADRDGYAALVPGDREKSEMWQRIIDDLDPMPPKKSHKALTPEEIELIGRWIDEGGKYETHWAYVPPKLADLPKVTDKKWAKSTIDRLIFARLDERGIKPSPQATKRELLRRVTFDLTGLPPTPEQAAAFMSDSSPGAYEKYVDSLLNQTAYGEHMAVWWLDLVRYGDTSGYHGDRPRPAWPYRDWVVKAFNDNMPFDKFSKLQIGGDLMQEEPTLEMRVAAAYNRMSLQTEEGGAQPKEYEVIYSVDRVTNFGEVWLGSSVGCAQCHDHKFDPILQDDFFNLAAFFADINQANVNSRGGAGGYGTPSPPFMFVPQNEEQEKLIAEHDQAYRQFIRENPDAMLVEEHLVSVNPKPPLPGGKMPEYGEQLKQMLAERMKLAKQVPILIETRALATPRTVRLLARGSWQDESGPIMQPATPAFLPGVSSTEDKRLNRLDLANWLFEPDHPLTARVVVNRLWGRLLGTPLSVNPIDLGSQGKAPTHPELMDYLAIEFRDRGWDLKHMIRLIVTSETYKQSANARADLANIDPDNTKLFARQSAVRLPAEAVRDMAMRVSGLMSEKMGGPSVYPYQPEGHWNALNFPRRNYPTSTGEDLYRRSLYTFVQRTFPHPLMVTFDAPSRETCTGQRYGSTTPLQALSRLNAPIFVESARVLAEQLIKHSDDDNARLDRLYSLALVREPRDSERSALTTLLKSQREHFTAAPEDAKALASFGASPTADGLDPVEVAAWTSVCRVVLNLHETITRN